MIRLFSIVVFLLAWSASHARPDLIAVISVHSGPYVRSDTHVSVSLDDLTSIHEEKLCLFEYKGGEEVYVPVQFSAGFERRVHWVLRGLTEPGEVRFFHLVKREKPDSEPSMKVQHRDGAYTLVAGERPVLQYNSETVFPPEGVNPVYRRSGFIHPLFSPSGTVLTEIQPPDHMHHYGLWNPWTRTTFRGKEVDFWNLAKEEGRVSYGGIVSALEGEVFSSIQVLHQHIAWPGSPDETIAMNELKDMRTYFREDGKFVVDFTSTLSPVEKIILEEYRYGGFVLRATAEWTAETSDFYTSRGLDRDQADGQRAEWCVVSGESGGMISGIVMMGFPANYNHPEPIRVWPSDANQGRGDVFINFSPTRNTSWTLEPGNNYILRYRMVIFEGEPDAQEAENLWNDYSTPPLISLDRPFISPPVPGR
jgi:hypothetical protein